MENRLPFILPGSSRSFSAYFHCIPCSMSHNGNHGCYLACSWVCSLVPWRIRRSASLPVPLLPVCIFTVRSQSRPFVRSRLFAPLSPQAYWRICFVGVEVVVVLFGKALPTEKDVNGKEDIDRRESVCADRRKDRIGDPCHLFMFVPFPVS